MIRFAVAAQTFNLFRDAVSGHIEMLCKESSSDVIIIDTASIVKMSKLNSIYANKSNFTILRLIDCFQKNEINQFYIRTITQKNHDKSIVVIDSTGFSYKQTSTILIEYQRACFHNNIWPSSIVLLCDEIDLYEYAIFMKRFFYFPAEYLSDEALRNKISRIQQKAWIFRWFGYGKFIHLVTRLNYLKNRMLRRLFL